MHVTSREAEVEEEEIELEGHIGESAPQFERVNIQESSLEVDDNSLETELDAYLLEAEKDSVLLEYFAEEH